MSTSTPTPKHAQHNSRRIAQGALVGIAALAIGAAGVVGGLAVAGATSTHHSTKHHVVFVNFERTATWVKTLQQQLANLHYYDGAIDGIYGPQTEAAVAELQRDASIHPTGQMNAATESALMRFIANGNNQMGGTTKVTPSTPVTTAAVQAIKTLQSELGQLNYYEGPVDGVEGPQTRAAITYLQRDAGLPQTGQMTAATQAALQGFLAHGNNQMGGTTSLLYAAR